MLKKLELNSKALQYIKEEINFHSHLSTVLPDISLILEEGVVFSFFPYNFSEKQSSVDYSESFNYVYRKPLLEEIETETISFITDFLNDDHNKYAVFETLSCRYDPIINKRNLPAFYINNRKYTYIKGDCQSKPVKKCLIDAQGYPTIILLLDATCNEFSITNEEELTSKNIHNIVSIIKIIIVGAFDGEGYLFWQRATKK